MLNVNLWCNLLCTICLSAADHSPAFHFGSCTKLSSVTQSADSTAVHDNHTALLASSHHKKCTLLSHT